MGPTRPRDVLFRPQCSIHERVAAISELPFRHRLEQYYSAAQDAYSWSNLVQLQRMSGSVGLMVGLSLSDRNLRRLLHVVQRASLHSEHYALLRKPQWTRPNEDELDQMHQNAIGYLNKFRQSGVKKDEGESRVAGRKAGIKGTELNIPGVKSAIQR